MPPTELRSSRCSGCSEPLMYERFFFRDGSIMVAGRVNRGPAPATPITCLRSSLGGLLPKRIGGRPRLGYRGDLGCCFWLHVQCLHAPQVLSPSRSMLVSYGSLISLGKGPCYPTCD
jgi:hypothetical protein